MSKATSFPLACAAFAFAALAHQSPTSAPPPVHDAFTVEKDVLYASPDGSDLHLDVYEPNGHAEASRPAVILIHGGGWMSFDKGTMRAMGQFLATRGFVAFSVDYRLFQGEQNRWPAQFDDVQRAVRWIRSNAAKYGVNPEHIGAFGHSAGAQLACLLGMEDTRDNSDAALASYSSRVQAVVDVSGPTDFTADRDTDDSAFLAKFFGTAYANHPEVWRNASPMFHVAKDNAPFLIVHGTQDEEVSLQQAEEFFSKLQSAGVPASLIKVNDVHTFQTVEARRQLAIQTLAFFTRYLGIPR
jgi:acetyl esterase/lipase